MAEKIKTRAEDLRDLDILHLLDHELLSGEAVSKRYRGMTRSAILAIKFRIGKAHATQDCLCEKPENCDGGMPARWWAS